MNTNQTISEKSRKQWLGLRPVMEPRKNKEERYSRVPRLSDTRYSAK